MEMAQGRFANKEGEGDLTGLESGMTFLQVWASMSMKEKLRQVRSAICVNRREIAHTRLEAIAGADNPYLQPHHHIRERTPSNKSWRGRLCHIVRTSGGAALVPQELHGRNTGYGQRDRGLRRPHQLRDQEC
jgi:hypothetical protein